METWVLQLPEWLDFGTIFFSIFYVEKWFFDNVQVKLWLK